jgi:hypothetical protein
VVDVKVYFVMILCAQRPHTEYQEQCCLKQYINNNRYLKLMHLSFGKTLTRKTERASASYQMYSSRSTDIFNILDEILSIFAW